MACKPLLAALTAFSCLNLHVIHWCNQVDDGIKILYKGLFMTLWAYALNTFSKREAANKRKKRGKRVVCVCVCVGGLVVARSCVWSKAHARKMAVSRGSTQDVTWHWKCNIVIIHHSKVPAAAAALSYKTLFLQNAVDGTNSTPPAAFSLQSASRCLGLIPGREIGYIHSKFLAVYLDTCSFQG